MIVLQTERLRLRHMTLDDAAFMLGMLNDPAWHRFIGDRGIRTVEGARQHILNGTMAMVARFGFGFYVVEREADGCPLGVCGLAQRDSSTMSISAMPSCRSMAAKAMRWRRRRACWLMRARWA